MTFLDICRLPITSIKIVRAALAMVFLMWFFEVFSTRKPPIIPLLSNTTQLSCFRNHWAILVHGMWEQDILYQHVHSMFQLTHTQFWVNPVMYCRSKKEQMEKAAAILPRYQSPRYVVQHLPAFCTIFCGGWSNCRLPFIVTCRFSQRPLIAIPPKFRDIVKFHEVTHSQSHTFPLVIMPKQHATRLQDLVVQLIVVQCLQRYWKILNRRMLVSATLSAEGAEDSGEFQAAHCITGTSPHAVRMGVPKLCHSQYQAKILHIEFWKMRV